MGILITARNDSDTKPNYALTAPLAAGVSLNDGQLATWVGTTAGVQLEKTTGVLRCLQALRERDWPNPGLGVFNVAQFDTKTHVLVVTLSAVLPTFTEDTVAVLQGADFTKSADSNTGHVRRMNESWREVNGGELLRGVLEFEAFKSENDGTVGITVSVGTGPVAEGRTGAIETPDATGLYVSRVDTAPAIYRLAGKDYIYIGVGLENICEQSSNFATPFWQNSGSPTVLQDAIGLDGVVDTAETVSTPDGGNSSVSWASAVRPTPVLGEPLTVRWWCEKGSRVTDFPAAILSASGFPVFAVQVSFDPNTGDIVEGALSFGAANLEMYSIDHGTHYEFGFQNDANAAATGFQFFPVYTTALGNAQISAAPGGMAFANTEFYLNTTLDQVAGTPPVYTIGAGTVVGPSTGIGLPIANHDNTESIYTCDVVFLTALGAETAVHATGILQVGASAAGNVLSLVDVLPANSALSSEDAASLFQTGGSSLAANFEFTPLVVYSATGDLQAVTTAGSAGSGNTATFTGFTVDTDILVGPPNFGGSFRPFLIRNIQRWTLTTVPTE